MECSSAAANKGKSKSGETKLCEIILTQPTQESQQEVRSSTEQEEVDKENLQNTVNFLQNMFTNFIIARRT